MSDDIPKKLEKQNEVIISLLGRIAFTSEKIHDIVVKKVVKKKQNPQGYIAAYNACDGNHNVNELAIIASVDQSTLSPILQEWEDLGIIYESYKPKGRFYKKLFPI
jgi:DNA-binding MarR family transcriptional regulator